MFNKIIATTKFIIVFCSTLMLLGVNANAAAAVTPTSAQNSLATPYFTLHVRACVELFDWTQFVADVKNGITESSPFIKKGCLRQENFASNGSRTVTKDANDNVTAVNYQVNPAVKVNTPYYKDFNGTTNVTAKEVLGNIPVIGITSIDGQNSQNNTIYDANGQTITKANCDRIQPTVLTSTPCIWPEAELSKIYSPQTARTGAPRIIETDIDEITKNDAGQLSYNGGPCYTQNGIMVERSKIDVGGPRERSADEVFPDAKNKSTLENCNFLLKNGSSFSSMAVNCSSEALRPKIGQTYITVDQGLCAHQFLYVIQMPTAEECQRLWGIAPIDYDSNCKKFWQKRFQGIQNNAPAGVGDKFIISRTYYGMYADSSFKCQTKGQTNCSTSYRFSSDGEWKNPDINGARKTFETKATREELLKALESKVFESYKTEDLRVEYNGLIRNMDGASTYYF